MSVTVDNTGQNAVAVSASTGTITSFVVGSGANRFIYLGVSQFSNPDRVPSATFNTSQNFTVHDAATIAEGGGTRRVTILKLVAPANATTANIVVTWPGAVDEFVIGATSWFGVDQTTPLGTAVITTSASSSGSSSVVVPNAAGDTVHDSIAVDGNLSPVIAANQTLRWRNIAAADTTEGAGQSADGAGSDITCTWSSINPTFVTAQIGVAIKQVGGGGGGRTLFLRSGLDGLSMTGIKQFNPSLG